jgi:hypothetical protein
LHPPPLAKLLVTRVFSKRKIPREKFYIFVSREFKKQNKKVLRDSVQETKFKKGNRLDDDT